MRKKGGEAEEDAGRVKSGGDRPKGFLGRQVKVRGLSALVRSTWYAYEVVSEGGFWSEL